MGSFVVFYLKTKRKVDSEIVYLQFFWKICFGFILVFFGSRRFLWTFQSLKYDKNWLNSQIFSDFTPNKFLILTCYKPVLPRDTLGLQYYYVKTTIDRDLTNSTTTILFCCSVFLGLFLVFIVRDCVNLYFSVKCIPFIHTLTITACRVMNINNSERVISM